MGRPKGSKNKPKIAMTIEDVAEEEQRKATEKELPDPEFDFREIYHSGDTIYYVWLNNLTGDKSILELKVRTVYARSLVAWEDRGPAHMIGYPSRDWIFWDRREAEAYYKSAKMEAKYGRDSDLSET